ncbi:hypothetical protein BMS3Bbin02_01981 [bacterium BMS3Bbin02]|nr:hypothetical protein BMS3Bbin02_01981 [bacterium BMS3Bbin02]
MKKVLAALAFALVGASCGGGASTTTTVTAATTALPATTTTATPTTTSTSTTSTSTTTTAAPVTTTTEPVNVDAALQDRLWAVVLVTADDVLNIRSGPGVSNEIVAAAPPTKRGLALTGRYEMVGLSTWVELASFESGGWVNAYFLTPQYTTEEIDVAMDTWGRMAELGDLMSAGGDISGPMSRRGLNLVYFDDELRHYSRGDLQTVMSSAAIETWSSTGCIGCIERTFAEAVGDTYLSVFDDLLIDAETLLDDVLLGGGGPFPPEAAVPVPFRNFHFVSFFDPGDNPDFDGLDWWTWLVFFDIENGDAVIAGMAPVAWAP